MTSVRFTSWARLEPSTSDPELRPGLVAETADPLWFLSRQWQLGELTGDDASSPALVEIQAEIGHPTHVRLGDNGAIAPYDPATVPLDLLAEREPSPPTPPTLFTAEVSLMLLEELEAAGMGVHARQTLLTDLRADFPLPGLSVTEALALSTASAALLDGIAAVAFDGVAVVRAAAATLPSTAVGQEWDEAVATVAGWLDRRLPATSAWVPDQLGSRVELGVPATGNGVTYLADRSAGDQLGWWSFDRSTASLGAGTTVTATTPVRLPAATARVPGAPAARYWEMEDAAIDLGAVGVAPNELARLIVLEYLLVYGNDMVVVPLDVPYGTRCVVTDVTVIDVSGERTTVAAVTSASGGTFRMWEVTGDPGALLSPPLAMSTLSGPVLEDVVVARDEQSNLAWLIERTGTDPAGGPVDLRRLGPPPQPPVTVPPAPPDAPKPPWRWRLTEEAPLGWHPLLPEADPSGATRLVVGVVPTDQAPARPPARSRILEELAVTGLPASAVPAEGIRLQRRGEAARWIDGSRHAWLARERRAGSGDAGSGVLFDVLGRGPV